MLLHAIVGDAHRPLGMLPLLSDVQRRQLLVEYNDTAAEYPKDQCIHELFEAQAQRTPDAIAVVYEDQRLKDRELSAQANQVARHLRVLGVGPDVLVGLCVERSVQMVVGLLGILKAGAAYLPLDPQQPTQRLALMLNETMVPVLLTHSALRPRLPPHWGIWCSWMWMVERAATARFAAG